MSPIDPISPVSPMDLSPISPAEAAMTLSIPTTPVIAPAAYLPRLRTSFHLATSDVDNIRRMSLQFQLPTPSPLALAQTPLTEAQTLESILCRGGDDNTKTCTTSPASASSMRSVHRQSPPWRGSNVFNSSGAERKVPSLVRQNANEGFERMQLERSTSLPLRVNTCFSGTVSEISPKRHSATIEQLTTRSPKPSSRSQTHNNITLSTSHSTRRSRSPIRKPTPKHNRLHSHRRRLTRPTRPTPTLTIRDPASPRTATRQTELTSRLTHLSRHLIPLISVTTGLPHPDFPINLLRYQLLTHDQLDQLARWYHQVEDVQVQRERWNYPCPIGIGKTWCGLAGGSVDGGVDGGRVVDLETKRRRWGRFIGLQGCESPVGEEREVEEGQSVAEMEERLEREWREALRRAREEERVREKIWRGRG